MKKRMLAALAAPVAALSIFSAPQAEAATNFEKVAKDPAELMRDQGILLGLPNGDLKVNDALQRVEMLMMLERAGKLNGTKGKLSFTDVPGKYTDVVSKAVKAKLVSGYTSKSFKPNQALTKGQFATIFTLSETGGKVPEVDTSVLNNYTDHSKIPAYLKPYIAYAILGGAFDVEYGKPFEYEKEITREEASKAFKPVVFDVIDFLTTNDIHGNIEFNEKYQNGGMAIIGGLVNAFRSVNPDGTVVVDGGDIFQGTLISNSFEGASTFDTMNAIKYDAAAIGNHEFDWGVGVLKERIAQADFPVMGANVYDEKTNKRVDWAEPYTIVEKGGYKIGIIGFATPQTPATTLATHVEGLSFPTPAPIAKELSAELREKGADFVIVTSHLPGEYAKDSAEIIGELTDLAMESKGSLDAIVGGHSHQRVAGHVNDIPVVEAQSYTAAMGHIQLFIDKKTKEVFSSESGILETKVGLTKEDEAVAGIVSDYQGQVKEIAAEVVSSTTGDLTRTQTVGRRGVSQLGNMISDAMMKTSGTQVAFQNIGGIRANIEAGDITYGDVFSVIPFDNYNIVSEMTPQQIKDILEGPLADGSNFLTIQYGGLKVVFDEERAHGDRILSIALNDGTVLYADGKFSDTKVSVVTNNFLGTGEGDGFDTFGEVEWTSTPDFQREMFADYLRAMKAAGTPIDASKVLDDRLIAAKK